MLGFVLQTPAVAHLIMSSSLPGPASCHGHHLCSSLPLFPIDPTESRAALKQVTVLESKSVSAQHHCYNTATTLQFPSDAPAKGTGMK